MKLLKNFPKCCLKFLQNAYSLNLHIQKTNVHFGVKSMVNVEAHQNFEKGMLPSHPVYERQW